MPALRDSGTGGEATPLATPCNLCGHGAFKVREEDDPPFRVLECLHCGLVFVHPFPDPGGLADHYDENYYRAWITQQKNRRIRMWRNRLDRIEHRIKKGHLLDVGCGDGSFLELAKRDGWAVHGTEYSPHASQFAGKRLGIQVFCGDLMTAGYREAAFDVVTLWHVLEHVTDPTGHLREIHRILKPSGLLVLAVPNVDARVMQWAYRIIRGRPLKLFSQADREVHLYHFSPATLRASLAKTGFRCIRLSPDTGIVEPGKRFVNGVATLLFHLTGLKYFNAMEAWAIRK